MSDQPIEQPNHSNFEHDDFISSSACEECGCTSYEIISEYGWQGMNVQIIACINCGNERQLIED